MKKRNAGFTLFFAMLVSSLALAIGLAIFDLTERQLALSTIVSQSQNAIYAADTGAECALFWDAKYGGGSGSAFATSSASVPVTSGVTCNSEDIAAAPWTVVGGANAATTTFTLQFSPETYCAVVSIAKVDEGAGSLHTTILSHGYNTCATGAADKVERLLQVTY